MRRVLHLALRSQRLLVPLVLLYLSISLRHLDVVPMIYEDEPWQASTGWKLAQQGIFGSDMFAGLHGMDRHYYGFMPLHPLLLAGTYRVAGLGLLQTRLEPVLLGLITLLLTYGLASKLFDAQVGLLSVLLLLCVRQTGLTQSQLTGILLIDMARIARYDMLVPVLGLASLHAYLWARRGAWPLRWALAGLLAGLAGLAHLYGAFWLVALLALGLSQRAGWRQLAALLAGFLAPWLAYLPYLLSAPEDWAGQTYGYGPRFDLLSPSWYWQNLREEYRRYGPGLGPPGWGYLLRPGVWATLLVLPASLVALARRSLRQGGQAERTIVIPALLIPLLFALLIQLKLANYLICLAPLGAIAAAWGALALWRRARAQGWRWVQGVLVATLLAIGIEGGARIAALEAAASSTTPYDQLIAGIQARIPPGSRVLGLHRYWLGLEQLDYRSWAVPLMLADAQTNPQPIAIELAMQQIDPDIILIDPRIRSYFEQGQTGNAQALQRWVSQRGYLLRATLDDPSYGLFEILERRR